MPPDLDDLLIMPPLRLPGVLVFLLADRPSKALPSRFQGFLDEDDKARAARYASSDLGHRFMTGRAALRTILTTFVDEAVPETAWRFGSSSNGKPSIQAPERAVASFNLSYAKSLIAIALSETQDIGVDIEISHIIPEDQRPWHLFAPDEQQLLRASSARAFQGVFFRFWTLKEAIAKQTGQGFATEFSDINTLDRSVVDGLDELTRHADTNSLLFHTPLAVQNETLHLAVSSEPMPGCRPARTELTSA